MGDNDHPWPLKALKNSKIEKQHVVVHQFDSIGMPSLHIGIAVSEKNWIVS